MSSGVLAVLLQLWMWIKTPPSSSAGVLKQLAYFATAQAYLGLICKLLAYIDSSKLSSGELMSAAVLAETEQAAAAAQQAGLISHPLEEPEEEAEQEQEAEAVAAAQAEQAEAAPQQEAEGPICHPIEIEEEDL